MDAVCAEARTVAFRNRRLAIAWLDSLLDAVHQSPPETLTDPVGATSMGRCLMDMATVTAAEGFSAESGHARKTVQVLWRDADPRARRVVGKP